MAIDMHLADLGQRYPLGGLVQQGRVSGALANQYGTELATVGFTVAQGQAIVATVAELDTDMSRRAEARDQQKLKTVDEKTALAEAKAFKRTLDLKLRRYFRTPGPKPVPADAFHAGGTLGKSTTKVSQYLSSIREKLVLIDEAIKPFYGGESAVAKLDAVKLDLDSAQTTQELGKLNLPEDTLEVCELKGRLYQLLAELVDAGRDVFDGQAELSAKFNKDLLLAAVRTKAAPEPVIPAKPT